MFHALALSGGAALALLVASRVARRPTVATTPFVWLSAAIAIWLLAGAGHALVDTVAAKVMWARLQYVGIASVAPLWLLFTAEYAGMSWFAQDRPALRRRLLWVVPILTVLAAATSEWHQALWTGVSLRADGVAVYGHGWWFWIAASYNYALVLTGTLLVVGALRRCPPFRGQFFALLIAALVPWAGNVLYISGLTLGPIADATPLAFTASYLLFAWAVYRNHLFDLIPVARDIVVDTLTDVVIVIDPARRLVDLNAAARDLARAKAAARGESSPWLGRELGAAFPLLADIPLAPTEQSATSRLLTTEGDPSTFDLRVLPVRSRQDAVVAWVVLLRDVTGRRRAEAERAALRERMQEQQRRESLSVLAGGLAHDFNNLLAGIVGNADLLAMQMPASSTMGSSVSAILLGAQRAADLVSKMLAYAGERHGSMARIDIDEVTRDLLDLLRASAARHCTVVYEGRGGVIYADPTQIRQVAMNLIINAAEAVGEESGMVTVATGTDTLSAAQLTTMRFGQESTPGEYAFLDVRDNGAGMDARTLRRIFDPFFTTKASGHGLGLAAVYGIVLGHRGALRVDSEPGGGSRFRVWFPIATVESSDPFGPFDVAPVPGAVPAVHPQSR